MQVLPPLQKDSPEAILLSRFRRIACIGGLFCGVAGLIVLIGGWVLGIDALKTLALGFASMKANTAAAIISCGLGLWLDQGGTAAGTRRRIVQSCAILILLLGGATLAEYVFGWDFRIDQLLFRDTGDSNWPGRMAPATATAFFLLGGAILLWDHQRGQIVGQMMALSAGFAGLISAVGNVYGLHNVYGASRNTGMAVHSALAMVVLSIGVLAARPDRGLMAPIASSGPGGFSARRMLPAAILVPVILGWLRWKGQQWGWYDSTFGVALSASGNIMAFVFLIWFNSRRVNRIEAARHRASAYLRESEARYRTVVESLPQMVWTCLPDGRCDYLSRQWIEYTGVPENRQTGFGWLDQIHSDDRDRIWKRWLNAAATGTHLDVEYRLRSASSEYRWFRALAVPLYDLNRQVTKWFGTSTDIEENKRAVTALREARDKLEVRVRERTAQLAQANSLLLSVLNSMGDGVVCANERNEPTLWNPAAEDLLGSDARSILLGRGTGEIRVYGPDRVTPIRPDEMPLAKATRGESCDGLEMFVVHPKHPEGVWLVAGGRPVRDETGALHGGVVVFHDISARKQAEESLHRQIQLIELAHDAVIVREPSGTILQWNAGAQEMYGWSSSEAIGQRTHELLGTALHHSLSDLEAALDQDGRWDGELIHTRRDGAPITLESRQVLVRSNAGLPVAVLEINRDITERKRAEQRFSSLLESAPDATLVVDGSGAIILVNAQFERLFGYPRREIVGMRVETLLPDRFRHHHAMQRNAFIRSPIARPMGANLELFGLRKDGSEFPIEISLSPLETAEGPLVSSSIRDITERKAAEQRIRCALEEKEAMLGEIHHRVKNNLQVVCSLLNLHAAQIQDPLTRRFFEDSQKRVRSMALVHEQLYRSSDLAHIDFGEYLRLLTDELLSSYRTGTGSISAEVNGCGASLNIERAIPCGLIVNELISNCLKHAFPDGRSGRIHIDFFADGPSYSLQITDDGAPLPPDLMARSTDRMGLKLVTALTRQLHGTIVTGSNGQPKFHITFPQNGN
ncbi:MAG: PAS domain S-box protein [Bryobacteraceae bacterium]